MDCRVLILGNRARSRHGLRALLGTISGIGLIREGNLGADALMLVDEHAPGLLVLDENVLDPAALELIRRVKERSPGTRVMLLAIYREWEAAARSAGADAFVDKCKSPCELLQTVARLIVNGDQGHGHVVKATMH